MVSLRNCLISVLLLLGFIPALSPILSAADTATRIFSPQFRTLKVSNPDNFMSPPVIRLNSSDKLIFSFDEIADDNSWLQYRLLHCNADWLPSRLVESEYLDGFNIADIEDFAFSENTFVHFVNYRIEFPNPSMRPLVSGNYLLQIFDRENPEKVMLQARFMITEDMANIAGSASGRTDQGHNTEWQQLDMSVSLNGLQNVNPYQDVEVAILQNGNDNTLRSLKRPQRTEGSTLHYSHLPELIFPAGNEYRRFESISNGFPGMGVDSLRFGGTNYHVWLKKDQGRALRSYEFDSTQRGRFLVREYNATDSDLGADYITVHYMLDMPLVRDADIYVDGEMTHGQFDATNRMVYDSESRLYRLEMPMKQGAYNYRYVTIPRDGDGSSIPSTAITEGNKFETRNEYWVGIYYHPPGSRADRLVGFAVILSQ